MYLVAFQHCVIDSWPTDDCLRYSLCSMCLLCAVKRLLSIKQNTGIMLDFVVKHCDLFSSYLHVSWAVAEPGWCAFFCWMPFVTRQWWYSPEKSNLHKCTPSLSKCQNGSRWEKAKLTPHSPLPFTFYFEHPSGWHRFWLLHISPVLLVCASWKQEWHSVIGWWRGAMPGQTGWGLGCHCKQSSAYSWNEITLWQWHCFAFEAACLFWTVNPLASTSSPAAPPSSLPPLTAKVRLQRASLFYLHTKKQDLSSTFSHSYKNPEGIKQTLISW